MVIPIAGGLDWLTWGTPFQSIWLNLARNSWQGVSTGMGTRAVGLLPPVPAGDLAAGRPLLLVLAIIGATRLPAVALAAVVTLLVHSLLPHKEFRFIYLATAAVPILVGAGASALLRALASRGGRQPTAALLSFAVLLAAAESYAAATRGPLVTAGTGSAAHAGFLAAHRRARHVRPWGNSACHSTERAATPTCIARCRCISTTSRPCAMMKGSAVPLRFSVTLDGQSIAEPPAGQLALR